VCVGGWQILSRIRDNIYVYVYVYPTHVGIRESPSWHANNMLHVSSFKVIPDAVRAKTLYTQNAL